MYEKSWLLLTCSEQMEMFDFFHFFFDHILIAWPRFQNLRCHEIRSDYYPDAFLLSLFAVDFNAFNFKLEEARFQGYSKMPSKFP